MGLFYFHSHYRTAVFYFWFCLLGQCHSHSLFQNCLRAHQFSIVPGNVCILYFLLYHVGAVGLSFKKTGFKKGMMIGFWAMALGAFIFVPAALTRTYEIFLLGLFTIGAGLAVLQTAANPYITVLGPREGRRSDSVSWVFVIKAPVFLHLFYSLPLY